MFKYYFKRYPLAAGVEKIDGQKENLNDIEGTLRREFPGKTVYVLTTEPNFGFSEISFFANQAHADGLLKGRVELARAAAYLCTIPAEAGK